VPAQKGKPEVIAVTCLYLCQREHFIKIYQNRKYGKRNRRIKLLRFAFPPAEFVTETSLSKNWGDSEKRSPFGRADLAASAALRAIRCIFSTASWLDASQPGNPTADRHKEKEATRCHK
jgi:hypothetical protein